MNIADIIYKECREEELDPGEKKQLKLWLEENPKNKKVYSQMKLSLLYPNDREMEGLELRVWNDLKLKLNRKDNSNHTSSVFSNATKIAAILILGIAAAFTIHNLSFWIQGDTRLVEVRMIEKVSLAGQKITTVLPDGTKVKLNAGSKIIVPERFEADKREVKLEGEAFFEVVPDPNKPFYVHFHNNQVKVLGTSFNIQAYSKDKSNVVAVKTGKVMVSQGDDEINLTPNELTVIDGSKLEITKFENSELLFGWIDNKLTFNKATLEEVMETVSNWYGISYQLDQKINKTELYTASHNNPTLKEVMDILAFTYNLNYEVDENTIIIK